MDARTTVVVLVAVAMIASVSLPAVAATPTPTEESGDDAAEAAMTAFMQSTAARANDSVENGMWISQVRDANASARDDMVTNRTDRLSERLERLRERNRSLQQRYENGSLPEAAYYARVSQLSGRIVALRESVDDTGEVAAEVGVDRTRLLRLRENASELRGPDVAALARGLAGNDSQEPVTTPGEPPDWVPTNETDGGPPDDPGNDGPPVDDPGEGADDGGPPDGGGNAGPRQGGGPSGADPPDDDGENADPPDGGGSDSGPPHGDGPPGAGPPSGEGA